jgi:hypothetical protein
MEITMLACKDKRYRTKDIGQILNALGFFNVGRRVKGSK